MIVYTRLTDRELIMKMIAATRKVEKYNKEINKATARMIGHSIADFTIKVTEVIRELGNRPESARATVAIKRYKAAAAQTAKLVNQYTK